MNSKIFSVGDQVSVVANKMDNADSYEGCTGVITDIKLNSKGDTLYEVKLNKYAYGLFFLGIELDYLVVEE